MSFLRRHGIALLALFLALSGSAYATGFPANVIAAKQLKTGAVTRPKIKDRAVNGAKIANDSVTGAHVVESSLARVPSAAQAATADDAAQATGGATTAINATNAANATSAGSTALLGGLQPSAYQPRVSVTCGPYYGIGNFGSGVNCTSPIFGIKRTQAAGAGGVFFFGGFSIGTGLWCHDAGKVQVVIQNGTAAAATVNWFYTDGSTVSASGTSLAGGGTVLLPFPFDGKRLDGQWIVASVNGVTTIKLHVSDGGSSCEIAGTVLSAP